MISASQVDAASDRHESHAALGFSSSCGGPRSGPLVVGGTFDRQDLEICDYARRNRFTILTNDLDFPQILAHTKDAAPSIVLLRGEPLVPEDRASSLLKALEDCAADLANGAILTLDWTDRPRARLLPLK